MTIENNIPIPAKRYNKGVYNPASKTSRFAAELAAMEVGQSTPDLIQSRDDQHMVAVVAKRRGIGILTRKLEAGGWRLWRTL